MSRWKRRQPSRREPRLTRGTRSATKSSWCRPARASRPERGFTRRRLLVAAGAGAGALAPVPYSLGRAPGGREVADRAPAKVRGSGARAPARSLPRPTTVGSPAKSFACGRAGRCAPRRTCARGADNDPLARRPAVNQRRRGVPGLTRAPAPRSRRGPWRRGEARRSAGRIRPWRQAPARRPARSAGRPRHRRGSARGAPRGARTPRRRPDRPRDRRRAGAASGRALGRSAGRARCRSPHRRRRSRGPAGCIGRAWTAAPRRGRRPRRAGARSCRTPITSPIQRSCGDLRCPLSSGSGGN